MSSVAISDPDRLAIATIARARLAARAADRSRRMTPPDDLSEQDRTTKDRLDILTQAVRRLRGRQWRVVPHPGPIGGEQHVAGGKSGALRAAIFGVNDGLVSNLSLIFGVSGAGVDNSFVIVAGVAGLLAGAFSMAAGEYISVRVQREVYERLIHLEAHEIGSDPEAERQELAELYVRKGLPRDLSDRLATELMKDPEVALETHAREELGLDPREGLGSPFAAAGSSFVTFSLGAFVPLLPFLVSSGHTGGRRVGDPVRHRAVRRRRRDVVPHRPSLAAVGISDARRRRGRGRRHLPRRQGARRRGAQLGATSAAAAASATTSCSAVATRPAGIERVPGQQPRHHRRLVVTVDQPENPTRTVQDAVGEGHPP